MKRGATVGLLMLLGCPLWSPLVRGQAEEAKEKKQVTLIKGLDGGLYEPYSAAVVEKVQAALKDKGLYTGEVNGQLDEDTMKALAEFQKQNQLTVSGVPSPSTRRALLGE